MGDLAIVPTTKQPELELAQQEATTHGFVKPAPLKRRKRFRVRKGQQLYAMFTLWDAPEEKEKFPAYRGLLCVLASFVTATMSTWQFIAIGIILIEALKEFGESLSTTSLVVGVLYASHWTSSYVWGNAISHFGPRNIGVLAALLTACGFLAGSWSQSILHLCLSVGIMSGVGLAPTFNLGAVSISNTVMNYRGIALGVASTGAGMGPLVMVYLSRFLLANYGFRGYLRYSAIIYGCTVAGASLLYIGKPKNKNVAVKLKLLDMSLFRRKEFVCIAMMFFFMAFVVFTPSALIVDFALEKNIPEENATALLSWFGVGTIVTIPVLGVLVERISALKLCGSIIFIAGLITIFTPLYSETLLGVYMCVYGGMAQGTFFLLSPLITEVLELRFLPQAIGLCFFCCAPGSIIGLYIAAAVREKSGSYDIVMIVLACFWFLALIPLIPLYVIYKRAKKNKVTSKVQELEEYEPVEVESSTEASMDPVDVVN